MMDMTKGPSIEQLLKDIEYNGYCYVKSEIVANKLRAADININVTYSKDDRSYKATYYNKQGAVAMDEESKGKIGLDDILSLSELGGIDDYEVILDRLNKMTYEVIQLNRAIKRKNDKIKELQGVIQKIKENKKYKRRNKSYKNGKRGSNFNG